ncbi:MAG: ribonucleoside-diphosphate reductase subunit alpha [Candidatus Algichlamydia australiensis]|nr:ribonucleoside-diphosphate reductase subunit alpha [Chlamydiales bacterium]
MKKGTITTFTVVKRNGTIVPFHKELILKAIELAFRDTKKVATPNPLPEDVAKSIENLTNLVVEQITELAQKGISITVEGIQDLVEVTLMKKGHHDVARDYIIYRDHHKQIREDSPENLKIFREGSTAPVRFKPIKIASSIEKAFHRTFHIQGTSPEEVISAVNLLTEIVVEKAMLLVKEGGTLTLHKLQDSIEDALMHEGYFDVAKEYILYRSLVGQQKAPSEIAAEREIKEEKYFTYTDREGKEKQLTESEIRRRLQFACRDLKDVDVDLLVHNTTLNFYEGIKEEEIDTALIMATRAKIEVDPNYSFASARLLLDQIYRETIGVSASDPRLIKEHKDYLKKYIKHGISIHRVSEELLDFDLDRLAEAMDLKNDLLFTYLGIQTLYDRYFIHDEGRRIETPQVFWMRVAMGLAIREEKKTERAIEFYNLLSQFYFVSSTPTLFNSGTNHSQLSSCFLGTVYDDLVHIFKVISDNAQLAKWAGGIGNDWTNVRATGARIKGTNGQSQGVVPFLKIVNDTTVAVNQGGKRKGTSCCYLETWHLDIEDFLELRKNTGDERRRCHDMNTANWIPDLFMKRLAENGNWTLFSPDEVSDLHDLYGAAFEKRYEEYEKMAAEGKIRSFKTMEAMTLWRKMLSMLFETGHPWITFKDPSNIRSPQDHEGVVHCSNLCTEILLNTSDKETAVCNLGSVNLAKHTTPQGINEERLAKTVRTAIRMLDNVIDINFYPIPETKNANARHRPIGLGVMGFQDALYMQEISFASHEAVEFADKSQEMISYYAILSSSELAKERGAYESFKGSKWDRGLLPIDTLDLVEKERGGNFEVDRTTRMDWQPVRNHIKQFGMRNSNTMAIAPTATISNIAGVTPTIEPTYKHLFAKSNLSGEFTVPNTHLIEKLKSMNLWDEEMLDDLKYFDGVISEIERIPDDVKQLFATCFEIDPEWIIECGSRRQKWIDMGQSLNLFMGEPSGKKLHQMYMLAWKRGLKTTYYLRTLGATQVEKSTTDINKRGLQPRWMKSESPSARVKVDRAEKVDVPVCNLEEGCESCQ